MISRLILGTMFIGWGWSLYGQQLPQFTQYMTNQYAYNAAYGGLERSLSITGLIRSQWSQFPGSPKTQMISGHIPLYFLDGAAGLRLLNEQIGNSKRIQFDASYNHVRQVGDGLYSAGLRLGVQQFSLNGNSIRTPDGSYVDNSINHNDPLLAGNLNVIVPTLGIGLYGIIGDFQAGLSIENLVSTNISNDLLSYQTNAHIHFYGGYQYTFSPELSISPSLLIKSDGVVSQIDIAAVADYQNISGGFVLRDPFKFESIAILAGVAVSEHIKMNYSFDIGLSGLKPYHDGTHELSINYNLNKPIRTGELPKIIYNPRYN